MTVTVRFARTAERDILNASIWWRVNRSASPDLFDRELANALALRRFKNARVVVLPETGHLLVDRRETELRLRVLALFGSKKTPTRP